MRWIFWSVKTCVCLLIVSKVHSFLIRTTGKEGFNRKQYVLVWSSDGDRVDNGFVLGLKSIFSRCETRRESFHRIGWAAILGGGSFALLSTKIPSKDTREAQAAVSDETDNFADNWWTTSTVPSSSAPGAQRRQAEAPTSDEVIILVSKSALKSSGGLGLELGEVEFRTNRRVYVKSVVPGSLAETLGIQKDWIVVYVNGQTAERTDAAGVAMMVSRAVKSSNSDSETTPDNIELRFRNPAVFQNQIKTLSMEDGDVTTQVAPAGDTTQRNTDGSLRTRTTSITEQDDQRLTVSQLIPPKVCRRRAETDDLLEISYVGSVHETGALFDGSAVKINGQAIPGRANDVSIFFVLGKQPFGQFPPGWDVGLAGMCVGERRRILVPPVLAYGSTGLPRRGIPPNATLQYDVTLVSLNGLATP